MKTVEIFDDENSIVIDDEYDNTDFNFFPEEKKFKVESSVKDDYFRNSQTFEYKISTNPLEIYVRLLESGSSSTDGQQHDVKDGVVLESEIMKASYYKNAIYKAKEHVEELKKQIEWSRIDIFGHHEINLYILSKHPEIILKEDFRKFLRQSIERIKLGVSKVDDAVKNDNNGLEIYTSESGRNVWYKPPNKLEEKEIEEYWKLPEEKRLESKYGKKFEYAEKFNEALFKEGSNKYVGISEYEYKISIELIEYIEKLLNKKETSVISKEVHLQKNNTNKTINVLVYLSTIFLIILKLTDGIDWSWFAVISPILIWEGFGFILGFLRSLIK